MSLFVMVFLAAFASAFLRTFNGLCVMRLRYGTVIPFSMMIAFVDVCVIASVVRNGLWIFVPSGMGQGVGAIIAMKIYERRYRRSDTEPGTCTQSS
jgi:hypothetical protein